jgi:alpha-L-arabinofuranosidase
MKPILQQAFRFTLACACLALSTPQAPAQTATVSIQANQPGAIISSNLFGIFFEEISMAGDGGIYAELVRNRLFEDSTTPVWWTLTTTGSATGSWSIDTSVPLSLTNTQALRLTMTGGSGSIGAANNGFYGIPLTNGATYNLSFYARASNGFSGSIAVALESAGGGASYAQTTASNLTTNWQQFRASLVPNTTDPAAQLVLSISKAGTVYLDFVSLFPAATFNNRTNGLRPALANMLVNLKPSFMRFPGGSWVDGINLADAYHWELTVGNPVNRTERTNVWGYMVSNGLGYEEYLQLCEDLGAVPLLSVNCGMAGSGTVSTGDLGPWVQEALDAIQYATGATNTAWGAQRAANGHPAPFNLQYIEIGNENGGTTYDANYAMFYYAIKSNYPSMNIIADAWPVGTWPGTAPVEIMDEHYYTSASTFESYATKYDSYSRSGPKVFVGEYAVAYDLGPGFAATLGNALGEAAFMTGLERNSDLVVLATYAPLFANVNNEDWSPDLIYFNGTNVYGTPSYYVQQMFSLNRGNLVLPASVSGSGLYVSSSLVQSSGRIIVKAVNVNNATMSTTFDVNGAASVSSSAVLVQLTGNPSTTNSFASPAGISPVTGTINNAGTNFTVTLPANSLSIFTLQASGFNNATNLLLQLASPLSVGQESQAVLSAQFPGQTTPVSLAGNYGVAYSPANTNVALVNSTGLVIGSGLGTTSITATYDGLSVTQSVRVVAAPATTLIHRYSFNDGTANDSVGTNNGTFYNTSGEASISGGQLNLAGLSGDYVDFGPGIITTTNITTGAISFEAWATFNPVNGAWARLFDFGNISGSSGGNYIFLTPCNAANGGNTRLAVSDTMPGGSGEVGVDMNSLLGQTNVQVVVVFNPTPARQFLGLYTNGVLAASTSTGGTSIASLNDDFSFLGHSLWSSDAWLNGSINEFRIYNGELNEFQIAADFLAGPNQTNDNVGAITSFVLNPGTQQIDLGGVGQVEAYLVFTFAGDINVTDDTNNLTLSSSDANIFTVSPGGLVSATGIGAANLTGVYNYVGANTSTLYTNSAAITVVPGPPASLVHRYSFSDAVGSTNVYDSVGGASWDGTLPNGGTFNGTGQLTISTTNSQYVNLPSGILSNYTAATVEGWVTATYLPANCMYYAFGNTVSGTGENYIFGSLVRDYTSISDGDWSAEQGVTGSVAPLPLNQVIYFSAVYNPPAGYISLYTNGVLAGINNAVTDPLTDVATNETYIGRSVYTQDPYGSLILDEFRIWNGALTPLQIAASQVLGPNQVLSANSPTLAAAISGTNLTLSWPLAAAGFTLESTTNLAANAWTSVSATPQIVSSQCQATVPLSGSAQFFRLTE